MKPFWVVDEFLFGEDDKIDFSHTLNKLFVDFKFVKYKPMSDMNDPIVIPEGYQPVYYGTLGYLENELNNNYEIAHKGIFNLGGVALYIDNLRKNN